MDSHMAPELTNRLCVMASSCPVASKELGEVRWTIRNRDSSWHRYARCSTCRRGFVIRWTVR
jgi:hypothetical protein